MYKRIVAGVDGSTHADNALEHAIALAKTLGAALRIVHVVDVRWLPARRGEAENLLAVAETTARADGVAAETRLVEASAPAQQPAAALVDEAASWPADLIVLGARGHRGVERLFLGSMADGVARRSAVPVLLVH
jgi:nucleotide-binding universal stress UspA family protein